MMRLLAKHTKALCKLSIGPRAEDLEEIYANQGQGWPIEWIRPYVELLLDQFGPDRLMWGSDWPLLLLESDYQGAYQTMREALGSLDKEDEIRIFRETAKRFYGLNSF
jgi:L-fuconolactonase